MLKGSSGTWYWSWTSPASQAGTYSHTVELWWDNSGTQILQDTKTFSILVVELKTDWKYNQITIEQGSNIPTRLTITLTNIGNDDMTNVYLEVIDTSGLSFQNQINYLGSISASASKSADFYITAPLSKPVGSYLIQFRVRYDDFRGITHVEYKTATVVVVPPKYDYTITVSGLETYSTDVYLDGAWKTALKNGETYTFVGLSGIHTISVSNIISISNYERLLCTLSSITVSSSGSYTFQYKKQYYLSISVKPSDSGAISRNSGWYDAGTTLTITATPNSGYQFREWFGDVSSSADTITITMDRPMEITAWFGKQNVISCKLSQTVITRLNTLKISGSIYPSPGYPVDVKVNFILPSGSTKVITTSTDYNGNYEVSFTPDVKGTWQVYASWDGDESFSPSKSETTPFTVTPIIYSFSIDSNFK
ncbi:MAG: InlB B-repeat-containing protein, partial [Candidatus Aenigmatarchaeota archaeon]